RARPLLDRKLGREQHQADSRYARFLDPSEAAELVMVPRVVRQPTAGHERVAERLLDEDAVVALIAALAAVAEADLALHEHVGQPLREVARGQQIEQEGLPLLDLRPVDLRVAPGEVVEALRRAEVRDVALVPAAPRAAALGLEDAGRGLLRGVDPVGLRLAAPAAGLGLEEALADLLDHHRLKALARLGDIEQGLHAVMVYSSPDGSAGRRPSTSACVSSLRGPICARGCAASRARPRRRRSRATATNSVQSSRSSRTRSAPYCSSSNGTRRIACQ